ncbi:hypothetical protein ACFL7M_04765 [Thermodesulfobacteriota bacterium]
MRRRGRSNLIAFIQTYSRAITIIALILAFLGTVLLSWDLIQWSNIERANFNQEYGVVVAMTEYIGYQKLGSVFLGISIFFMLAVELCKK